jgi:ubiquinone/menaquinone biosynthesis C-methylase UbiE
VNSDAGLHAPIGRAVSAAAYDRYIGLWSRLFVPSLLRAAGIASEDRVLDVATGTGEAAIAAVSLVGDAGIVIGADISAAMLDAARARLPANYRAVVTDGQALAFRDASFDAVLCQLGLMFFPDPARGLAEFRRVLRRGGRAAVFVISKRERAPMWGVLAESLSRHLPDQRDVLNLSFSLADPERLEQMLAAAGFQEVRVARETRYGIIESFAEYWAAIEAGTGQQPLIYLGLPELERRAVREEVQEGMAPFDQNGRLEMGVEMLIASGRA